MKDIINWCIITVAFLPVVTSCSDILDQIPEGDFNEETVWQDVYLAQAFLGNCYDMIGGHPDYALGMRRDLLASCTDELLSIRWPRKMTFLKGTLSPENMGHFGKTSEFGFLNWEGLYNNIQNLNIFIANIDEVHARTSVDEALIRRMKGEAYFIRAYDYSQLLLGYGGLILADKPFEPGFNFESLNRSSLKNTMDFILADIEKALEYLPSKDEIEQGRATRGAAAALKSRLLLFCASDLVNGDYAPEDTLVSVTEGTQEERWLAARDAAKAVMEGNYGYYALVGTTADPPSPLTQDDVKDYADNYYNIFNQKGEWNEESIWGIQYTASGGNTIKTNLWNGPIGFNAYLWRGVLVVAAMGANNEPTEPAVRSFEMADGIPFRWDLYDPGEELLRTATAAELAIDPNRNPYNGREPRFYASILYHGARWQSRSGGVETLDPIGIVQTGNFYNNDGTIKDWGLDTRLSLIFFSGIINAYCLKKFLDIDVYGRLQNNTNTWVEFRYAEILLNFAEACIELGGPDLQNGIDALNMVRNRAGLPDRVTTDQATAREYVRHERAIEFFAEGHRWYDIRRWMIAGDVIKDVHVMRIKEFENGDMEWNLSTTTRIDRRSFIEKNYWLPIPAAEIIKAPWIQNNPGY